MTGEVGCFMEGKYWASAEAIVNTSAYVIPYPKLVATMQADWDTNMHIVHLLAQKNNIFHNQIIDTCFLQASQRITSIFLNLHQLYGSETEHGSIINLKFTQQDVANITGLTRVTVNKVFNMLVQRQIIQRKNKFFIIEKMHELKKIAQEGVPEATLKKWSNTNLFSLDTIGLEEL